MDYIISHITIILLVGGLLLFRRRMSNQKWSASRYAVLGMYLFAIFVTIIFLSNYNQDLFIFFPVYYLFFVYSIFNENNQSDLEKSSNMYKMLMDNSDEIICQYSIKGRLLFANTATTRIFEYTTEELQQIGFRKLFPSNDIKFILNKIREMRDDKKPKSLRISIISKSQNIYYLNSTLIPVLENGTISAFQIMAHDVTNELRMINQAQFLASVITESKAPIFIFNENGEITVWNRGIEELTDKDRSRAVGKLYNEIFPNIPDIMLETVINGGFFHTETLVHHKDISVPVALSVYQVKAEGQGSSFAVFLQDLSQQKLLEDKLMQNQRMEALGRLAGGVAHDFNNILTIVSGNAMILKKSGTVPETMEPYLNALIKSTKKGANLTSQLLTFSRKQPFTPQKTNLPDLVYDAINLISNVGWDDIQTDISIEPNLPEIWLDPGRMQQVLMNLCVNARDAMPDGGRLFIRCERSDRKFQDMLPTDTDAIPDLYVTISIKDTGCGMDETTIRKIFEPFFTTKEISKGTGLGLANVHGIIKQHHGWIDVESTLGKGSTFRIYMPTSKIISESKSIPIIGTKDYSIISHSSIEDDDPQSVVNSLSEKLKGEETILFIDNETLIQFAGQATLEKYGYNVLSVSTYSESENMILDNNIKIDAIVLEWSESGQSESKILPFIKNKNIKIPIILQCDNLDKKVRNELRGYGVVVFLQKPFIPEVLVAEVRNLLDSGKEKNSILA